MGATLGGFANRLTRSKAICGWCRRGDTNANYTGFARRAPAVRLSRGVNSWLAAFGASLGAIRTREPVCHSHADGAGGSLCGGSGQRGAPSRQLQGLLAFSVVFTIVLLQASRVVHPTSRWYLLPTLLIPAVVLLLGSALFAALRPPAPLSP
jgi:hypothetical protein